MAFLAGCEGQTNYIKNVANQSNDTLHLKVYTAYLNLSETDTFNIFPGMTQQIYFSEQRGGNSYPVSCSQSFDSISVSGSGGKSLTKDILDETLWDLDIRSNRRGNLVDQECTFTITDQDLQ